MPSEEEVYKLCKPGGYNGVITGHLARVMVKNRRKPAKTAALPMTEAIRTGPIGIINMLPYRGWLTWQHCPVPRMESKTCSQDGALPAEKPGHQQKSLCLHLCHQLHQLWLRLQFPMFAHKPILKAIWDTLRLISFNVAINL